MLSDLLTSSQGAPLPTMQSRQLPLATSTASFVPGIAFVSADSAVNQPVTNSTASLPRPQMNAQFGPVKANAVSPPQAQFNLQTRELNTANSDSVSLPQFNPQPQFQPDVTNESAVELTEFTLGLYAVCLPISVCFLLALNQPAVFLGKMS